MADLAEKLGLEVDRTARPAEGRDGADRRRSDTAPAPKPLTGSPDEEGGEGSETRRKRRTILGAANVRRPMLTAGSGATFLGR